MGGDFGRMLSEAGLGFMQGYAQQKVNQNIETQQRQAKFAMQGALDLAQRGELGNMAPEFMKPLEKYFGKEGLAQLQQMNQLNQTMRNLRQGTEALVNAPVQEERLVQDPRLQGPPTPEGTFPLQQQMTSRAPTNVEMVQRANQLTPQEMYFMTGDTSAGGLSAQSQSLAQQRLEHDFQQRKYTEEPSRKAQERQENALINIEQESAKQGKQAFRMSRQEAEERVNTGQIPEGFQPFIVGDGAILIQRPPDSIKIDSDVQTELAGAGITDIRQASPKQIAAATQRVLEKKYEISAANALETKRATKEMAENSRLADISPQRYESTFNARTGQLAPTNLTVKGADSREWKVLPDLHKKVLQEVQQSRASLEGVVRDFQKLYGQGGELANIKATLPSRTKAGVQAFWNNLTQKNPTLATLRDQAGQLAQALNRGSYGGVGTQTESDRKYAIEALTHIASGAFLLDTPEVQQKKINEITKRFNRIEGAILGNAGQEYPGTLYMDITKSSNEELQWSNPPVTLENIGTAAGTAQTQQGGEPAPINGQTYQDAVQKYGDKMTPEVWEEYRKQIEGQSSGNQEDSTQKKNLSDSSIGRDLEEAAETYDVPVDFLATMARIESAGDPDAVSPTGATGIFQFTRGTGKEYGLVGDDFDNRKDARENIMAGAKLAKNNKKALERAGIEPEPYLLYMAHQQGVGGTKAIVEAADKGREVSKSIRRNMDLNGGKGLSPQEFLDMWQRKWERHEALYLA